MVFWCFGVLVFWFSGAMVFWRKHFKFLINSKFVVLTIDFIFVRIFDSS